MEKIIDGLLYQQLRPGVYIYYQNGEERVRAWYTGEIIAARRKELKLTQRQLADAVNLNRSTLSRYESGEYKKIDFKMLEALAKALDTSVEYLTGRVDDPHAVLEPTPEETREARLLCVWVPQDGHRFHVPIITKKARRLGEPTSLIAG